MTNTTLTTGTIRPGTAVILPDGTEATIRAIEIGGATYAIDVHGTILRGWSRDQLMPVPAEATCECGEWCSIVG